MSKASTTALRLAHGSARTTVRPTPERILDAAERCLGRLGMQRASMADVAAAAGMSRGSVYFHFPDRDALVHAVLARAAERFVASSEAAVRARRTLATQVAEAAVFVRRHLHDGDVPAAGDRSDTLLATLLTANLEGMVASWVDFWQPFLAEAAARGEIRPGLDRREAAEWIVRIMLSLAVMPSAVIDLDDARAVRGFVARYIVQGLIGRNEGARAPSLHAAKPRRASRPAAASRGRGRK
jgi:AcrR family transcriptional regulator